VNEVSNVTDGLRIINTYDPEATVEQHGKIVHVILDETKSSISDEDADKLHELGWYWEDREVWIYDPDPFYEEN
jgi:hypothetical protein